jgi:hypothetical protein
MREHRPIDGWRAAQAAAFLVSLMRSLAQGFGSSLSFFASADLLAGPWPAGGATFGTGGTAAFGMAGGGGGGVATGCVRGLPLPGCSALSRCTGGCATAAGGVAFGVGAAVTCGAAGGGAGAASGGDGARG